MNDFIIVKTEKIFRSDSLSFYDVNLMTKTINLKNGIVIDFTTEQIMLSVNGIVRKFTIPIFETMFCKKNVNQDILTKEEQSSIQKELNNDKLLFGWFWYLFFMITFLFFNDRIELWILISIIFGSYRIHVRR